MATSKTATVTLDLPKLQTLVASLRSLAQDAKENKLPLPPQIAEVWKALTPAVVALTGSKKSYLEVGISAKIK